MRLALAPKCKNVKIETHTVGSTRIAEELSDKVIIQTAADGLDLLGSLYYQGFDCIIIHEKNITPNFFDLKNGMAGEILQKFSNYRVRFAIVGNFTPYVGGSVRDFMYESNKGKQIAFVGTIEKALQRLVNK